jgi:uncharacterized protein
MTNDKHSFPWGTARRFNSYAQYCIRTYGTRLQKLSIEAGFTCPNRDGSISSGGCAFCSNDAFNPSYCDPEKSITQQINEGIEFHKKRYKRAVKYLAYFQPYSNTYAPLEKLQSVYQEAISHPQITGLSIGTRPDCINDEILGYLQLLAENHFISIEYGIESCYDDTLVSVNRGHTFGRSVYAIKRTAGRGIHIGAHLLFGLPGEKRNEMLEEAAMISALPLDSVKLHQLQILKGTAMEKSFFHDSSAFQLFSMDEYIEFIIDFLELLRPSMMIERLAAEVPPRFLVGPGWGLIRNDQVMQKIEKRMEERNTWQGKLYKPENSRKFEWF